MRIAMNRWLAVVAAAALILGPAQGRVLGIPIKMRPLPGAKLSIHKAIEEEASFAAVCEAVGRLSESSTPVAPGGAAWGSQEFKVVEVLFGRAKPVDRIEIGYRLTGRPIGSHERVIWIGHTRNMSRHGSLFGLKALPDTPQNRQAVNAAASRASMAWGEAVEGVQVRLRANQSKWNEGAVPRLSADVRNQGKRNLFVAPVRNRCELEVDGRWYQPPRTLERRLPPEPFPPGRQYDNIAVDLHGSWELAASRSARSPGESGRERLRLTAGKHTIRVAFTAWASKKARAPVYAPGEDVRAVSNSVEIEIVAKSDKKVDATQQAKASTTAAEPTVEATDLEPDDRTTPVRPASDPTFDSKEILDKLRSIDAVYAAAFTASGKRSGGPVRKWKFAMFRGRIALEEDLVEITEADIAKRIRLGPPRGGDGKPMLALRSTFFVGPTAQAKYDWVGILKRYGPQDPWPENDPGPATAGSLDVVDPDSLAYMLQIKRTLWCLGRGYSKHITEIRDVSKQEDGRLKVAADGLDMALRPGAKWELVIDPDAEYLVRSAELLDNRDRRSSYTNSGLKRHGPHCVPEKGECKGAFINASFEFQSASFEADVEFLRHAKATMQPPYLIHTDVSDQRMTPELMIQYDAGKMSPRGGKPGFDLD